MAGANMKDIKRRIKSVGSTTQITNAMQLVASSKLRKAKERVERYRPFFEKLYQTMAEVAQENTDGMSVYTRRRKIKATLQIVIAGDRGLAGGYNANILKRAQADSEGRNVRVLAIGKKAVEYYQKRAYPIVAQYQGVGEELSISETTEIGEKIVALYRSGEIDEAIVYYTGFVSPLQQEPSSLTLLPLDLLGVKPQGRRTLTEYDPSPQAVFDSLVPTFITGTVYGAIVESFVSEQAARRTAMESATDNAQEMIDGLQLQFNRARQGAITQELTEIVAGAQALG